MKVKSYQQFAIVVGDSAQHLTEQLNAKLVELAGKDPSVSFEGMIARISYRETVTLPESLEEEYKQAGVRLTCQDCPFFTPMYKTDGTEDKRIKYGDCPFKEFGRTFRDSLACDQLFTKLNNGEVSLCLAESK